MAVENVKIDAKEKAEFAVAKANANANADKNELAIQENIESDDESTDESGDEELSEEKKSATVDNVTKLEELYQSVTPFYTKAVIRDFEAKVAAIDITKPGETNLEWTAIDGSKAFFSFEIDHESEYEGQELMVDFVHIDKVYEHIYNCADLKTCGVNSTTAGFSICEYPILGGESAQHWTMEFEKAVAAWEKSEERQKLVSILEKCGDNLDKITKVICFGNGDFNNDPSPDQPRSLTQHAAALTIVKILRERSGKEIPLLAQDPAYSESVKAVLKEHGFIIYNGVCRASRGYIDVDDNTFVMTINPGAPVRSVIADLARPAILMCNGYWKGTTEELDALRGGEGLPMLLDPDVGRVKDMLEDDYEEHPMENEKIDYYDQARVKKLPCFWDVFIYSRKETCSGDGGDTEDMAEDGNMEGMGGVDASSNAEKDK